MSTLDLLKTIGQVKKNDILFVCEPIEVDKNSGGVITLPIGTRIFVEERLNTLIFGITEQDNKLFNITIGVEEYHALEIVP